MSTQDAESVAEDRTLLERAIEQFDEDLAHVCAVCGRFPDHGGIPAIRWLLDRAESYWRDADAFAQEGDAPMSAAYRAIADELRRCVVEVGRSDIPPLCFVLTEDNGSFCGRTLPCPAHSDGTGCGS